MEVSIKTTQLDATIQNLERIARGCYIEPVGLSQESLNKLEWLRLSGRDFLAITVIIIAACIRYAKAAMEAAIMSGRTLTTEELYDPMAKGFGKQLGIRFDNNGNDVSMIALAESTLKRKSREGYPSDIGVEKGDLKKEVKSADWKARPK